MSNPSTDEELRDILWDVHQNGIWFRSPILDDKKHVLPVEKLASYGMDVQQAEHELLKIINREKVALLDEVIGEPPYSTIATTERAHKERAKLTKEDK